MLLLQTERLRIQEFDASYVDSLVELDSDPEVMRYINGGHPTPKEAILHKLPDWIAGYRATPPAGFWAVHLKHSDEFAGWVHLRPDRQDEGYPELGYRLARRYWGRGLGSELARAMIRQALGPWRHQTLVARTLIENRASQRVMEKAGMRRELEFTYPAEMTPGFTDAMRRAVRYRIDATDLQTQD